MSKHEQSQKGRQFIAIFVLHKTQTAGAICDGIKTKASKLKLLKRELERFSNSTSKIQDAQIIATHLRNVQFIKGFTLSRDDLI